MPDGFLKIHKNPRGVSNRNRALEWIYLNADDRGVVYFADDDNTYDLRVFQEVGKRTRFCDFKNIMAARKKYRVSNPYQTVTLPIRYRIALTLHGPNLTVIGGLCAELL